MTATPRSHGKRTARAMSRPRELAADSPDLAGAWKAVVVTLFPGLFPGALGESLTGAALKGGLWQLETVNLREFGIGKHRAVDDTPAGGGPGMVLRADVVGPAIEEATALARGNSPLICLSPRGRRLDQALARELSLSDGVTLVCGRFEGIDERALEHYGATEVSIGDFVMTGGEIAAMALIDAAVRLRPGVIGNAESVEDESHATGLLEHPHYTRPSEWRGLKIPETLLGGNHAEIAKWRREMSERLTRDRRPDLWAARDLDAPRPSVDGDEPRGRGRG